jgi:hypothetical protein
VCVCSKNRSFYLIRIFSKSPNDTHLMSVCLIQESAILFNQNIFSLNDTNLLSVCLIKESVISFNKNIIYCLLTIHIWWVCVWTKNRSFYSLRIFFILSKRCTSNECVFVLRIGHFIWSEYFHCLQTIHI